jgi:hypothetical protein
MRYKNPQWTSAYRPFRQKYNHFSRILAFRTIYTKNWMTILGYMNFGPRIFRAGLSARKFFFLLQNRITLTLIFISHRAEKSAGRNSVLPRYLQVKLCQQIGLLITIISQQCANFRKRKFPKIPNFR